jgi:molybdopterin molybdotransferase
MDGWAVSGDGPWCVVGQVLAGAVRVTPLRSGEAVVVGTGSALPTGADAVLRREDGLLEDGGGLRGRVTAGQDVRPPGEECQAGEILVEAGARLTPIRLGLIAAAGHDSVAVVRRPRACVLILGDELLTHGPARHGSVRDSLGVQVPAWLTSWGCDVVGPQHVRDTVGAHATALADCADADVIITTGGTAAGPVDLLHDAFATSGGHVIIDGVDCRPGHPMVLGGWNGRWLVGLPGNPHAAIAALMTLALPLLQSLHGTPLPPLDQVMLGTRVGGRGAGTRLIACRLKGGVAHPCAHIGSGMLRGLADADGLAVVTGGASEGGAVDWLPLPCSPHA